MVRVAGAMMIHISHNHNDEIVIDTDFLNYFNYTMQLSFLTQLTRIVF